MMRGAINSAAVVSPHMVIVVLGKQLVRSEIHESLQRQVDIGIRTLRETDSRFIVMTGGQTNPTVQRTESEAMRGYAIRQGVGEDRIRTEETSRDTIGNAFFSRPIVDDIPGTDTIHLVTACYHVERATFVFEQCFGPAYDIKAAYCNDTSIPESELSEEEALERAEAFFDPITPGDLDQIEARIDEEHEIYDFGDNPVPGVIGDRSLD